MARGAQDSLYAGELVTNSEQAQEIHKLERATYSVCAGTVVAGSSTLDKA